MAPFNILIIGGGVAGIASAIAISKAFPTPPNITVFELRSQPGTIGGAVNLTPNAVRCLDLLGVLDVLKRKKVGCEISSIQLFSLHTGASLGTIDYNGNGNGFGGYRGWRVLRSELMQAMLEVAQNMEIRIEYGKKLVGIDETSHSVTVKFEDGTDATGDLVLGCDGIHSATRMQIEPARVPKYSGISSAYGFTKTAAGEKMFFKDTGLSMSRSGAFLTTYCDDTRQRVYVAAMMESKGEISKEGWRAMGKDQDAVRENIFSRFSKSALPNMEKLVNDAEEWFLYPVYILPPDGIWSTGRVMLLGDAAHAMPPKGESIGYALEDAVIFSCVLSHFSFSNSTAALQFYEKIRRKTINDAYKDASFGWDTNKDTGFLFTKIMEWVTPLYLWWTKKSREESFGVDPREIEFPPAALLRGTDSHGDHS